jgi:1-deoxy-D-xylulose-5-phosphate reductoisomerase
MNKALEVIAAHWLYGLPADRISVVMHPPSIAHSLVQYVDGSVLARPGNPDMRTPIAQALAFPERIDAGVSPLDLARIGELAFEPLDSVRFPCLALGYRALATGGTAPAILNAANEIAVAAFLDGHIAYTAIAEICTDAVASVQLARNASLEDALAANVTARAYVRSRLGLDDGSSTRAMPARWQPDHHVRHKSATH